MEITIKFRSKVIIKAIKPFIKRGDLVLDIGCGNGVVSKEIIKHFNCKLVGTDILEYLKKDIEFVKMQKLDKLPFKIGQFDIGLILDVLHHTKKEGQINIIREAQRVCKKVIIFEDNPTILNCINDFLMNILHNIRMPKPMTFRSEKNWIELFNKNNINFDCHYVKNIKMYPFKHFLFVLKR